MTRRGTGPLLAVLGAMLWASCASNPAEPASDVELVFSNGRFDAWGTHTTLPHAGTVVTTVTDANTMAALEAQFGLGAVLMHAQNATATQTPPRDNARLADEVPLYTSLAQALEEDIDEVGAQGTYTLGAASGVNRLFNKKWLRSPYAFYDLIAVVNRVDRMDFHDLGCGEVRLIYRLAYEKTNLRPAVASRLPMTLNVVYLMSPNTPKEECAQVAQAWKTTREFASHEDYARWIAGLMQPESAIAPAFLQVEVNLQTARMPSENKDDFGGHAEYLLRIFKKDDVSNGFARATLENTPDAARIAQSPELKSRFISYLQQHVSDIDRGVFRLPEEFLAYEATSFSTQGMHRRANHPYSQVLTPNDLRETDFTGTQLLASPEAMLMRLDDMTCQGCHQSRSIAGFHVIGEDRTERTHPINAVRLSLSPHVQEDIARREQYFADVIDNFEPDRVRKLSFAPYDAPGAVGSACFTQDANMHLRSTWSCRSDLQCMITVNSGASLDIGTCVRTSNVAVAGDVCLKGSVTDATDPRRDRRTNARFGCAGYACLAPEEGTPGGLCYAQCDTNNSVRHRDEICAYNGGPTFDACAASGNFANCIGSSIRRGLRGACDENTPCRDDYICQRYFDVSGGKLTVPVESRGFCVPTYFLYQMRLDGHPRDPM